MKMNRVIAVAMTSMLALGVAAPALAAGGPGHDRGHHGWNERGHGHGKHHGRHDHDRRDDRRHYSKGYKDGYRDARYHEPRVVYRPAPSYGWVRGHRYRDYYQGPVYVVHDYDRYHLRRPPHGHHWIRDDRGDMLLVAVATGIIADIILHH